MVFFLDMKGYNQIQSPENIEIKSRNENKERKTKQKKKTKEEYRVNEEYEFGFFFHESSKSSFLRNLIFERTLPINRRTEKRTS